MGQGKGGLGVISIQLNLSCTQIYKGLSISAQIRKSRRRLVQFRIFSKTQALKNPPTFRDYDTVVFQELSSWKSLPSSSQFQPFLTKFHCLLLRMKLFHDLFLNFRNFGLNYRFWKFGILRTVEILSINWHILI